MQPDKKSDGAICTNDLISVSLAYKHNPPHIFIKDNYVEECFVKGFIFSLKRKTDLIRKGRFSLSPQDIKYYIKRYGVYALFIFALIVGLALGTVYALSADREMLNSLDFLFFTNLEARLSQNVLSTFCACFASDFVFLFAVFLLGLTPWGIPVMPFVVLLRGFGTGITAGYLFSVHSLKGIVFYLFVLLPGTFLFCMALILFSAAAFNASGKMFFQLIADKKVGGSSHRYISDFLSKGVSCLILAFLSAVIDAALWGVFAGNFNF